MCTHIQKLDNVTVQQAVLITPWNRGSLGKLVGSQRARDSMQCMGPECFFFFLFLKAPFLH